MGQPISSRYSRVFAALALTPTLALCAFLAGCKKSPTAARPVPNAISPTVVSCVPAATDLIVAMGDVKHLVAVSTFDPNVGPTKGLPGVGDYVQFDWELLGTLKPQTMIIQKDPSLLPASVQSNADALGIKLVKLTIVRLDDVFKMIREKLGPAVNDPAAADALEKRLRNQLTTIASRTKSLPAVKTLLVIGDGGQSLAGPDNFVDDELRIAGGSNVAGDMSDSWPSVDREKLIALAPDAIIQLLPDASPQVIDKARQYWKGLPALPAVKNGRVLILSDSYCLLPGAHVGDIAQRMADFLHPPAGAP